MGDGGGEVLDGDCHSEVGGEVGWLWFRVVVVVHASGGVVVVGR